MENYVIYDCEIIKCIPTKEARFDDYEYCDGWHDHANMGISVIGYYQSHVDSYHAIVSSDLHNFPVVVAGCKIVGFNSRSFDDRLMAANNMPVKTDYDLLEEVRIAAGFAAHYSSVPKGYSYSLDAIARANGMAKTGSGALAPQLWQQGKHQEVIDYCLMDVKITKTLLDLGMAGKLIDPNTGSKLQLKSIA